jgi:hypothetical protein
MVCGKIVDGAWAAESAESNISPPPKIYCIF